MESTKSQKRIDTLVKWSPVLLLISVILFLASVWFGPFSLTYLMLSVMFGLIYTILALVCWKLESYPPLYWILFILTIFLLVKGNYVARDWTFPEMHHFNWWLDIQYLSAVFMFFFLTLFGFRTFIRKYISGRVNNMDNAI